MTSVQGRARGALAALYAVGFLILIDQATSVVAPLIPFQLDNPQWRFGAFGMAMGHTSMVLFADVLVLVAATGLDHRSWLRTWGVVHLLMALLLGVLTTAFVLDAVQLWAQVQPAAKRPILLNTGRVFGVSMLLVVFSLWTAVYTWRSGRRAIGTGGRLLVGAERGASAA